MAEQADVDVIRAFFTTARDGNLKLVATLVDDPEVVMKDAEARFEEMIPTMAYADNPSAPMASAVFGCGVELAIYLVLRDRGIDVHDFGSRMLEAATELWPSSAENSDAEFTADQLQAWLDAAAASQRDAKPGEFVYEAVAGDESSDWGMNIKSCAICAQYSRYGAMDLVPYMCATDDVMSDLMGQGLRRTGTIALGAHQCDFRYQSSGEPLRVAEQYPQRIRIRTGNNDAPTGRR